MAATVANVFTDATTIFPDMPGSSNSDALRWFNDVHKDLVTEFQLVTTTVDIVLDTTNREYDWNENHVTVWSANYLTSATAVPLPVRETSREELDVESPGWEDGRKGIPERFYLWQNSSGANKIGFDCIPQTATDTGYPTVRLVVSVYAALAAGDSLPATLRTSAAYSWTLAEKFAGFRHRDALPEVSAVAELERGKLAQYIARKQRNNEPRIVPWVSAGVRSF